MRTQYNDIADDVQSETCFNCGTYLGVSNAECPGCGVWVNNK